LLKINGSTIRRFSRHLSLTNAHRPARGGEKSLVASHESLVMIFELILRLTTND